MKFQGAVCFLFATLVLLGFLCLSVELMLLGMLIGVCGSCISMVRLSLEYLKDKK